jgi:hypothetical protein
MLEKKQYNYIYEDCYLILFEGNEILHIEYIEELELVEDFILESQEAGLIPCLNINRIKR